MEKYKCTWEKHFKETTVAKHETVLYFSNGPPLYITACRAGSKQQKFELV